MSIFFRLVNFGVLIVFLFYIFKKYLYQPISDQIAEKESFVHGLVENNKVLEEQQHDLEMRIAQQEQRCKELVEKISIWQEAVIKQRKGLLAMQAGVVQDRVRRLKSQQQSLEQDWLKRAVLPRVLAQAQKKLEQEFSSAQVGQQFIADIVSQLRRES